MPIRTFSFSIFILLNLIFQNSLKINDYLSENKSSQLVKDSLINYSYILNSSGGNGTCFFYKKNRKIYLITALHCITDFAEKVGNHYKSKIQIQSHNGSLNFTITPELDNINKVNINEGLDIYVIQIDAPYLINKIYYVNDFIKPNVVNANPSSIICFGYPRQSSPATPEPHSFESRIISTNEYMKKIKEKFPDIPAKNFEKINNWIREKYFIIKGEDSVWYGGYSGSPVFGEFVYNNKRNYYFLGILTQETSDSKANNLLIAINLKTVLEYFEKNT